MVRAMTRQSGNQATAAAATDGTPQGAATVQANAGDVAANEQTHEQTRDQIQEQAEPRARIIVETSATDAYGDEPVGRQSADAAQTRTLLLAGEAMRRISEAAWAAEASEQAVLASKDPLQDNPQAEQLAEQLARQLAEHPEQPLQGGLQNPSQEASHQDANHAPSADNGRPVVPPQVSAQDRDGKQ